MSFQDRSLRCSDCGVPFTFSAADQEYFKSRGYIHDPKRCPSCREIRQTGNNLNSNHIQRRETFAVTCSQCGKDTRVPFKPRIGAPVYCSECYSKVKASR